MLATQAGDMMLRLVPDIRRTAELVEEISAACAEQDIGAGQINVAIQQLDTVTQQNAAAAEEMAATSEELSAQAEQLEDTIGYFRLDEAAASRQVVAVAHHHRPAAAVRPSGKAAAVKPGKALSHAKARLPASRNGGKTTVAGNGFTLDMTTGKDAEDAEFQAF